MPGGWAEPSEVWVLSLAMPLSLGTFRGAVCPGFFSQVTKPGKPGAAVPVAQLITR